MANVETTAVWFYVAAALVFFMISVLKGAFGGGFGILTVPTMTLFILVTDAVEIAAPLFCIMDLFAIRAHPPKTWETNNLCIIVPASLVGIAIGSVMLGLVESDVIALLVAIIAIGFSAKWFIGGIFYFAADRQVNFCVSSGVFLGGAYPGLPV